MIPSTTNLRRWLVAGALCATAGCSDSRAAGVTGTDDPQSVLFAMATEAVAEANRLYAIADTAAAAGQWNRATLLWAAIDGLQFGSPMHEMTILVDGAPVTFTAIVQEAELTEGGTHHSTARSLIAWSGERADRILVAYDQIDGAGADAVLYLDGGDAVFLGTDASLDIQQSALGVSCVYEQETPLVGPRGTCTNATMSAAVTATVHVNGDTGSASHTLSVTTSDLAGVLVSRALEDF